MNYISDLLKPFKYKSQLVMVDFEKKTQILTQAAKKVEGTVYTSSFVMSLLPEFLRGFV
jgi:hypothetical protein